MNNPEVILVPHGFQKQYELGFANGLAAAGVNVTLIGSDETERERFRPSVKVLNLRGSQDPHRPGWIKAVNMLRYFLSLLWHVARHRKSVVHVIGVYGNPALFTGVVVNALLRVLSRRLVVTVHNILPHNQHTAWNRFVYRLIFRSANVLVVHTPKIKQGLAEKLGIAGDHVVVMEHGIDELPVPVPEAGQLLREQLGWQASDVGLLLFGNISHYKGPDILVRAFEHLDGRYRLLIAGKVARSEAAFGEELAALIAASPRRAHITMWDEFLSESRLPALFAAADVAVMPYRYIDQSGVLFMAHSHGLPIVAFDVGSLANYLAGPTGTVVGEQSPQALALGIAQYTGRTGQAVREQVRKAASAYLWEHTVHAVTPAYGSANTKFDGV